MLSGRESIADALRDPRTGATARDRITLAWFARRYAQEVIGLRPGESYRDVVMLDRDSVSYVVSAAPVDSLRPYQWCFPVAGCLPYIGYFSRRDADREAGRLRARGYDVATRGVSAYSLGGWLPDPIYSSLLDESRGWVANTVIHELTHATVFLAGRAGFNESLASFVGDRGSLAFLRAHYGPGSRTVHEAAGELADYAAYERELGEVRARLLLVYASGRPRNEILLAKTALLEAARARIAALPLHTLSATLLARRPLNNAVLATHATYNAGQALFEEAYVRLGRDLPRFVAFVRTDVARRSNPEAYLRNWVRAQPR